MDQSPVPPSPAPAAPAPPRGERLVSLDAFRGFDILVMVFVNFIAGMAAVPFILRHAPATMDAYTLTDVVFPGFLFIVGVSIPLAMTKRIAAGDPTVRLVGHVLVRSAALLLLGVIEVNSDRFSPVDTGMGEALWSFLVLAAVFVIWAATPKDASPRRRTVQLVLRLAGAALLLVLLVIYRGKGDDGAVTWLQHSWWGILGMIGWTYLAGSLLFIVSKGNRTALAGAIGFMTALYIGGRHGALDFLGPVNTFLGHGVGSILGSHSSVVTAGMLAGTLFLPRSDISRPKDRARFLSILGVTLLAAGYVLRPLHGFNKIAGTESWCLATAGICALLFLGSYLLLDALKLGRAAAFLIPAGRNPLAAYFLPGLLQSFLVLAGTLAGIDLWSAVWPFRAMGGVPGMLNGALLTAVVLALTTLLTRAKIVLKL